jgi:hypothetical protein
VITNLGEPAFFGASCVATNRAEALLGEIAFFGASCSAMDVEDVGETS